MKLFPDIHITETIGNFLAMLRAHAPMRFWVLTGASIVITMLSAWQICIFAYGDWPVDQAARRLDILGKGWWFTLATLLIVVASLTLSKVSAKAFGGSLDIGHDDSHEHDEPAIVKTTTTTEVTK